MPRNHAKALKGLKVTLGGADGAPDFGSNQRLAGPAFAPLIGAVREDDQNKFARACDVGMSGIEDGGNMLNTHLRTARPWRARIKFKTSRGPTG